MFWINSSNNNVRLNLDLAISITFASDAEADVKMIDGSTHLITGDDLRSRIGACKTWSNNIDSSEVVA